MSDIVEIALDSITDFADFEKLACEILRDEGFPTIQPLGGLNDQARDAVVERFYQREGRRFNTVFQITTQETIETKLRSTIKRLEEAGIEYSSLVIVTSRALNTHRQDTLKRIARELDVHLDLFERKILANRLANFDNGIFYRHFPDVEKQVRILVRRSTKESLEPRAAVRAALAFTGTSESDRARSKVLDELVLALLLNFKGSPANSQQLADLHSQLVPGAQLLQEDQIRGSLDRWTATHMVENVGSGAYRPGELGLERSLASAIDWNQKEHALSSEVVDSVEEVLGEQLDEATRGILERNATDALGLTFRLMGLELTSQILGLTEVRSQQVGSHERIIAAVQRDLPENIACTLAAALGELIANPSEEQAEALTAYACGFLGASLMEVDPAARELQSTRMAQKVFVLDTDFLISCLVTELPNSPGCLAIVQAIIDSGARVIVPDACLDEAANHAGLAHRSVNFFGPRIFGLTRAQALEQIQNAFAAGWFFRNLVEQVEFPEYIQNYYEASAPLDYITRVVESTLPEGVEIGDLVTLLGVSPDKGIEDRLSQELLSIIQKSRKSQYRTPEQTTSLAQTDARIYAAALAYESRTGTGRRGTALGGSCYLITSSLRFIRAVEHVLKHNDEISARPHSIAALFRLVGKTGISAKNFVALFDNPLLQHAVACCREDVNALLEAGLSTRGKTLPRLIWDLDTGLHQKIAEVYAREGEAEKTLGDREELEMDRSYIKLFRDARQRGYSSLPAVRSLAEEITALQEERSDLRKQLDELIGRQEQMETSIGVFGRRKQRYLRRIGRGEGR